MAKKKGRLFNGLLNVNKPAGISSARCLDHVRRATQVRKSGHTGTLDPMASGVLVVCMGKGTKLVEKIMDQPKVYAATARLDVISETHDTGSDLAEVPGLEPVDEGELRAAAARFKGLIQQRPPIYSAVKIQGRPAYKLAREGKPVELAPRPVVVYWMHVSRYAWPEVDFEVCCGRGTYIRSIVRDLGETLGAGGCLTRLERHAVGPFRIEAAVGPDELANVPLGMVAVDYESAVEILSQPPDVPDPPA